MGRPASNLDDYLEWQQRLANHKESGLSIDDFCLQKAISKLDFLAGTFFVVLDVLGFAVFFADMDVSLRFVVLARIATTALPIDDQIVTSEGERHPAKQAGI